MSYTYEALSPGGHQEMLEEVFSKVREQVGSYKTASGSLVSFPDGADLPMPSFICNISAVQDLHGQDHPWVGGAGKNKLNPAIIEDGYTINEQGELIPTTHRCSTTTEIDVTSFNSVTVSYTSTVSGTKFIYATFNGSTLVERYANKVNGDTIDTTGATKLYISWYSGSGDVLVANLSNLQVEVGSTATDFAPYSNICPISGHTGVNAVISPTTEASAGTTIAVSWQTEAGEVFGGYVDLVSGVLTVTHKEITYDGVTSGKMFSSRITGSNNAYYHNLPDGFDFNTTGRVSSTDMKRYGMINSHYDYTDDSSVGFYAGIGTTTGYLQPRILFGANSDITTIELANQWLATQYANGTPWQVVYPLATPITYQLTPTQIKSLLGNNNAWCDTGDIKSLQYQPNNIIAELRTEILALQARVEELEQTEQTE